MTAEEETNRQIVIQYFNALQNGDMAAFSALFSDNILWHQPGSHPFSGIKKGINEIGEMIAGLMKASQGSFALKQTDPLMINGNLVTAPVVFQASTETLELGMKGLDLFRIENKKIVEVWLFSENQLMENEFWLSATQTE
jgi:hypothetical protein